MRARPHAVRLFIPRAFLPLVLLFATAAPGASQVPDSGGVLQEAPGADSLPPEADTIRRITPGGAFLRSALVPGWGHTKVGAQGRGAFYFVVETTNAFLFLKTRSSLARVRDQKRLLESAATARLQAQGIEDPDELEAALAEDPTVADIRLREEARSEQLEDWMALGIFFLFLGGADAFVSAHLADFPAAVEVEANPGGGVEVGFSVPVGR